MEVITIESDAFKEIIRRIEGSSKVNPISSKSAIYNNSDLCSLFKISTRTLQNWRNNGKIGFSQINDTILYSQNDIDEFLSKHHCKPFKK
jgi:hypothetical protein